ncbi:MAG: hypothetical protein IH616_11050 [Gemmatimonadales bacterium]|jgi:hypothetical protein|nr:hypothetical protein [Gemmatimonadales bacterium]
MDDHVANGLTPAEEDPELHRMLADLPAPEPARRLDERVLSRVRRPAPRSVRRVQAVTRELVDSGRIWFVVGGLAVGSLLPLSAMFLASRVFAHQVGGAVTAVVTRAVPWAMAAASARIASLVETARGYLESLGLSGQAWAAVGGGGVILLLGCALGLRRTMTPGRTRR